MTTVLEMVKSSMILDGKYLDLFLAKVSRPDDPSACWIWNGKPRNGYSQVWDGVRTHYGHRIAYELWVGEIPDGYEVDHLCHDETCVPPCPHRRCVNPAHLEAKTQLANNMRSTSMSAKNARKTHCAHGHEFTPENTHITSRGTRSCKACWSDEAAKRWARISASRPSRAHAEKTHCPQGHPYDEANTYRYTTSRGGPGRLCRTCARDRARRKRGPT